MLCLERCIECSMGDHEESTADALPGCTPTAAGDGRLE